MADDVELAGRLARIEERLDELCRLNRERGGDHEQRIRSLERWKYALPTSAIAAVVAAFAAIFGR